MVGGVSLQDAFFQRRFPSLCRLSMVEDISPFPLFLSNASEYWTDLFSFLLSNDPQFFWVTLLTLSFYKLKFISIFSPPFFFSRIEFLPGDFHFFCFKLQWTFSTPPSGPYV